MCTFNAVAYISRAKTLFDQRKLDYLLDDSRQFNIQHKVSGVLLYSPNFFFQYFEGVEDDVAKVYERIQKSSSHEILFEVFNDKIEQLHFPDWCMGFCTLPEGYIQKNSQDNWLQKLSSLQNKQDESHVLSLIMTFWNNMNSIPTTRAG
jgi:Sensors of blue-light using FAD